MVVVVVDSVVVAGLASEEAVGLGLAAGAAVSVFCSHAVRRAAPARIQMYFFIIFISGNNIESMMNRGKRRFWSGK